MESLEELQRQLWQAESELSAISTKKHTPVKYDYEKGETYGEESYYNEYSDPNQARYLMRNIEYLKDKIAYYDKYKKAEEERKAFRQEIQAEYKEKMIRDRAHQLYEQRQTDYKSKGPLAKLGALFTGKKPKRLDDSDKIMEEYRGAAEESIRDEYSEHRIAELEAQRKFYHEKFSGDTPMDIAQRATIDEHIDKEIAELQGKDMSNGRSR